MTQEERRLFLIRRLLEEQPRYQGLAVPDDAAEQKYLLRALLNVRAPAPAAADFLEVQDAYLQAAIAEKGITGLAGLQPAGEDMYLWQGDITTLLCGAIVNAANSRMLGCFCPNHGCIDNAIHTYAGVQLRLACAELMRRQAGEEETGKARLTPAFNLPCDYVIHTVGPIVSGALKKKDKELLASCYRSCLELAERHHIESIAFCCISTGEFHFPNGAAAQIAVQTIKEYRKNTNSKIKVIWNVFKDVDYELYQGILRGIPRRAFGADAAPERGAGNG